VFTPAKISLIVPDGALRDALDADPHVQRLRQQHGRSRLLIVLDDRDENGPAPKGSRRVTSRELEVLVAVASGRRTTDIARLLRRSPKTITKHRASVQGKLGLRGVAQLTAYAILHGLVDARSVLDADRLRARDDRGARAG
jgi:DNA-binding NarL/FixJ family response regulator